MSDELIQHAEREVISAAIAWEREQKSRLLSASSCLQDTTTPASERLKTAVYMLNRARTITGKVRLEEIERAMREKKKEE